MISCISLARDLIRKEISALELKEKLKLHENIQLIDVREPSEYEMHNIGAVLIPLGQLVDNLDKIKRDVTVVVHCQSGIRSKKAVDLLIQEGYKNVFSLKGGIAAFN